MRQGNAGFGTGDFMNAALDTGTPDLAAQIVVVDDEQVNLKTVTRFLASAGYRSITTLSDSARAIETIIRIRPDMVLLDVIMPGVSGIDILRAMRRQPDLAHIPVVIFTAAEGQATKIEALEAGASDFLRKPLDPSELNARVHNLLLLKRQQDQLKKYSVEQEERLTELAESERRAEENARSLEVANRELMETTRQAREACRAKSEFLARMSHELRTPLTSILGYADILAGSLPSQSTDDAATTIKRNGEYLLDLINDILDFSKIEAGKLTVEQITCRVPDVLAEVASLLRMRAEEKELTLEVEYASPIPAAIQSDPMRLQQILVNLVANAVKFTRRGGVRIVAHCERGGEEPRMRFEVIDSGIGMTPIQVGRLFQPFAQADVSTTREFGGTGLGLTISQRLADALGGRITVSSVENLGSTFALTIPTGPIDDADMLTSPHEAVRSTERRGGTSLPEDILAGCRILLVEDGLDNQRLLSLILRKAGANVTTCDNGREGLEEALAACSSQAEAGRAPYDIILMDMQMPVMDGYEATRRLRLAGYTRPVVALTAHATSGAGRQCLAAGCDDYMTKPIDRETLLNRIVDHVDKLPATAVASHAQSEGPK